MYSPVLTEPEANNCFRTNTIMFSGEYKKLESNAPKTLSV